MENASFEQPRQQSRFVRILKIIGLVLLSLYINLAPEKLLALHRQLQLPTVYQWPIAVLYLLVVSTIFWALWKGYRAQHQKICQDSRIGWKDIGIALAFAAALIIVSQLGSILNTLYSGNPDTGNDMAILDLLHTLTPYPAYLLLFQLVIVLIAPLMEEMVYRAYLTKYFFQTPQNNWIMIISSALFTLNHLDDFQNPVDYFIYFSAGLIMYLAYRRRGSIWDAVLVHVLNNSWAFLLMYL